MSAPLLSVVVPMWNEEGYAAALTHEVEVAGSRLVASGRIGGFELVAVDDGSTDSTPRLLADLATEHPWVRPVTHERNRGLGGAVRSGLAAARGDLIVYTDADLPCSLDNIDRALDLLERTGTDIVAAWRTNRDEGARRAVYSIAYNSLVRRLFGLDLRDVNFAFKLFRRPVIETCALTSEGSFIDAELLVRARLAGFRVAQLPVRYQPRTVGVSTLSSPATIRRIIAEMRAVRRTLPGPASPEARRTGNLLIVNADDYGLTEAVSRGILRAHTDGIVTSTSVLTLAPGFGRTIGWLRDHPNLGVGAHLALVGEDPPLLPATQIPTLVDRRGRLYTSWREFVRAAAMNRIDQDDVRAELTAQLDRVLDSGVTIDHLDTHQHLHLWPIVGDVVADLAQRQGVIAVRTPSSRRNNVTGMTVRGLRRRLVRHLDRCGIAHVERSAGVDEAGDMRAEQLHDALAALAGDGPAELVTHPGEADDPDRGRYRWHYRWGDELAALVDPRTRELVDTLGFRLGTYADLTRGT